MENSHCYDDIIYAPRHISRRHAPMTPLARAAIFSPYAALTGFESQILEARHHRCNRIHLVEEQQEQINMILNTIRKHDVITITYFFYDPGTDGRGGFAEGEYVTVSGKVLNIIPAYRTMRVGREDTWADISFEDIWKISHGICEEEKCDTMIEYNI